MKILLTGKNGQLGYELQKTQPDNMELISFDSSELDITNESDVNQILKKHNPEIVINAAAYTAVDKAEDERQQAFAVNSRGCEYLANACKSINAKLIHISTDFVFDGTNNTPYKVSDPTKPVSVYGESKLAGEEIIQSILPNKHVIIRTAWVYSSQGDNFVKTMLRLMKEKQQLGVVYDQVGTPTWAKGLAIAIWGLIQQNEQFFNENLFHWTDAGVTSWYDFAVAIQEIALEKELVKIEIPIHAITASAYPTRAARPSFSVLDKTLLENTLKIETIHWRKQLAEMLNELKSDNIEKFKD